MNLNAKTPGTVQPLPGFFVCGTPPLPFGHPLPFVEGKTTESNGQGLAKEKGKGA